MMTTHINGIQLWKGSESMSIQTESEWICPVCKSKNSDTMWQTVNSTINPEIALKIADGSLFAITCRSCGYSGRFNYNIHLHDMDQKRYCMYQSPQHPDKRPTQKFMKVAERDFGPSYDLRIVYDQGDFVEWAAIWRDGLDDAVMLCVRVMLVVQVKQERGEYPEELHYLGRAPNHGEDDEPEMLDYMVRFPSREKPLVMKAGKYIYDGLFPQIQSVNQKCSLVDVGWIGRSKQRC